MAETLIATDRAPWFDAGKGLLDRRVFADPEIYRREMTHIFARGWNFVCHESQLPDAGSFFMSYIGEDEVIAVRDRSRTVQVLLNSCPHRGNTVCHERTTAAHALHGKLGQRAFTQRQLGALRARLRLQ